jgi:pilus assembly protein Flp/PilA
MVFGFLNFTSQPERSRAMVNALKRFWKDEEGVTMIEYSLIAALVAIASIAAWTTLGENIQSKMNSVATTVGP